MLQGLAEIGAIFLLFTIGLETKPRELLEVGSTATTVAVLGVVVPFVMGFVYMKSSTHAPVESIFVAAAMVATMWGSLRGF